MVSYAIYMYMYMYTQSYMYMYIYSTKNYTPNITGLLTQCYDKNLKALQPYNVSVPVHYFVVVIGPHGVTGWKTGSYVANDVDFVTILLCLQ